jgi:hypothetical protein
MFKRGVVYGRIHSDDVFSYTDTTAKAARLLPGQKIIVCAALLGRPHLLDWKGTRRGQSQVEDGYDSHISPSRLEYVTFDSAQLLPLYVLHIEDTDRCTDNTWNAPAPAVSGAVILDPRNARHDYGLLTDMARKHFPFGFGAGERFVVLDIAKIDDDEEVWGEYQDNRYDEVVGESMDEFQDRQWSYD